MCTSWQAWSTTKRRSLRVVLLWCCLTTRWAAFCCSFSFRWTKDSYTAAGSTAEWFHLHHLPHLQLISCQHVKSLPAFCWCQWFLPHSSSSTCQRPLLFIPFSVNKLKPERSIWTPFGNIQCNNVSLNESTSPTHLFNYHIPHDTGQGGWLAAIDHSDFIINSKPKINLKPWLLAYIENEFYE